MDDLEQADQLVHGSRRSLLSNQLVVVIPDDSVLRLPDASSLVNGSVSRIVLADPRSVPAGVYARQYLEGIGLWEKLLPRLLPTVNVRAALAAVESGNADAGFVYLTDALVSKRTRVAFRIAIEDGPDISYPVAVIRRGDLNPLAVPFVSFLSSPESMKVFRSYGFQIPSPASVPPVESAATP